MEVEAGAQAVSRVAKKDVDVGMGGIGGNAAGIDEISLPEKDDAKSNGLSARQDQDLGVESVDVFASERSDEGIGRGPPAGATLMRGSSSRPEAQSQSGAGAAASTTLGEILDPTCMDPALWMHMPMHIVELILSKVPFRNLVNMRRVCKYWNELILSEGFSPPFVPALIMFARTPTVRKMMLERNQPVVIPEKVQARKWKFFRIWKLARRMVKRKRSPPRRQ